MAGAKTVNASSKKACKDALVEEFFEFVQDGYVLLDGSAPVRKAFGVQPYCSLNSLLK